MTEKRSPTRRDRYPYLTPIATRWGDNDSYGHVNNVVYYAFFDSAVNRHLIDAGVLDIAHSTVIGLVVETGCTFFASIGFPDLVHVGLKVVHLGNSSVRYEIALFRNDADECAALGTFVHVYVERSGNRPTAIPAPTRNLLETLR